MMIDYRQEVVKRIALCINPLAVFTTDTSNNILIPGDDKSIKAMLTASAIVDNLQYILGFHTRDMTGVYQCVFERYSGDATDRNVTKFLDLLKIMGVNQADIIKQ